MNGSRTLPRHTPPIDTNKAKAAVICQAGQCFLPRPVRLVPSIWPPEPKAPTNNVQKTRQRLSPRIGAAGYTWEIITFRS